MSLQHPLPSMLHVSMTKITSNFTFADASQCVRHYDVFSLVHFANILIFLEKYINLAIKTSIINHS